MMPAQIVGHYDDGASHGFLKEGTAYIPIDYSGAIWTEAWGINNASQIVGDYLDDNYFVHGPSGNSKSQSPCQLACCSWVQGCWAWQFG